MSLRHGVILIEGKPGSGKSFKGMEEMLIQMVRNKRPVYSNLPVRDRPLKKYLTRKVGTDAFDKLWTPLTEAHFHAYCERANRIDQEFNKWKEHCRELGQTNHSFYRFEKWYTETHPEDPFITKGENANWIVSGAVLILDEVHQWTPQAGTQKNPHLQAYASMHRHHHHLVYLLTQDAMQVAIEWRRQCIEVIRVDDASSFRLWGPISMARLGMRNKLARYAHFSWEKYQIAKSTNGQQVQADRCEMRWLPWNSHIFHLYDSYGRTGISRSAQNKRLAEAAEAIGVAPPKTTDVVHKKVRPKVFRRWLFWVVVRRTLTACVFAFGLLVGWALSPAPESADPEVLVAEQDVPVQEVEPGMATTIGEDWVRIDGERVYVGNSYNRDYILWHVDRQNSFGVLVHRDVGPAWLLVPGRPAESIGSTNSLMARFRSEVGGRTDPAGPDAPSTLGGADSASDPRLGAQFRGDALPVSAGS